MEASRSEQKDRALLPYWDGGTAGNSALLWVPTASVLDSSLVLSGWQSKTGAQSWYCVDQFAKSDQGMEKVFCPLAIRALIAEAERKAASAPAMVLLKAKKIRLGLTHRQRALVRVWLDGSRWWYNQAVDLYRAGFSVSEYAMRRIVRFLSPKRFAKVPSKILSGAIADAYKAKKAVWRERKRLKKAGIRKKVVLRFRSRKHPIQSLYLCHVAWSKDRTQLYPRSLGRVHLSRPLPEVPKDGRLVVHQGRYYATVSYTSPRGDAETQGRVVALDPGIRSFLTFYSEADCGKIGTGAFGRIQRLCAHLDGLIGRMTCALGFRKARMKRACSRMRWRIRDLIGELHRQTARWLVDTYDVILLPTFETREMVPRNQKRHLNRKSVRNMLTFAHYRFKQFLKHKAFEAGKLVLDVNEAYTSKTVSWTGEIVKNLGGAKTIRSQKDGHTMDRDINGARGILLRALGDTPKLRRCLA